MVTCLRALIHRSVCTQVNKALDKPTARHFEVFRKLHLIYQEASVPLKRVHGLGLFRNCGEHVIIKPKTAFVVFDILLQAALAGSIIILCLRMCSYNLKLLILINMHSNTHSWLYPIPCVPFLFDA